MITLIDGIRQVIGNPDFLLSNGEWDYGAITEYFVASIILCIVISSIFRLLTGWAK